eukprot:Phypoly_transcript_00669.p1 GENE.Phypoly_transcript_00669~~Phypoly_transcript_00669.p1  ORF type:complete len:889 (+),score=100.09 Phypoly_transcript_00669:213-2879(+)
MNVGTLSQIAKDNAQHQYQLEKLFHEAFPAVTVYSNVRKDGQFINPHTGSFLELDLWVPDLSLGFEFQDAHHYVSTWYHNNPLSAVRVRDNLKEEKVKGGGITLIQIPCWWDALPESLFSTISFQRPDLIQTTDHSHPIPLNPPPSFFAPAAIPDVGELMLATFVSLQASATKPALVLSSGYPWWLGEKYDGVRCIWHPGKQNLYTRHRYVIHLESSMRRQLSSVSHFDGEIWNGRGCYQESSRVVRSSADTDSQKILAFDTPTAFYHKLPFEERYSLLYKTIGPNHPLVIVAVRIKCWNEHILQALLQVILDDKGEGVVLRKPRSRYEPGRSFSLLKIKSSREDMEALVLETSDDGCLLQFPNGTKLQLEHQQISADELPEKGDVVTIEYDHFSKTDVPVAPILTRIREDLEWKDVLRDFVNDTLSSDRERETEEKAASTANLRKPFKFWTVEEGRNARNFMEEFARQKGLDPLLPETWYSISLKDILLHTGELPTFLRRGYVKTLMELFPELNLQEIKFPTAPIRYYSSISNRRAFFDAFAKEHGFDPLISENWQRVNAYHMRDRKGSDAVLYYYQGSMTKALIHLYPQLTLDVRNYTKRKKLFFEQFAKDKGFDPLVAENWYSVTREDLEARKEFTGIMKEFRGSFIRALQDVFPAIQLNTSKFSIPGKKHWRVERNRKSFFEQYAKDNGFDPLVAENWYAVRSEKILARKFSSMVVRYYGGSVRKALLTLYPNIGLRAENFESRGRAFWTSPANRRKYFDDFARHHGFDPLVHENWYSISVAQLAAYKRIDFLYRYHKNLQDALTQLYPDIGLDFGVPLFFLIIFFIFYFYFIFPFHHLFITFSSIFSSLFPFVFFITKRCKRSGKKSSVLGRRGCNLARNSLT